MERLSKERKQRRGIEWRHHLSPLPQFRRGIGGEGNILKPLAPMVSSVTTHVTFGPTNLTRANSVCTRRIFGGIGHRTRALRSELEFDALTTRLPTTLLGSYLQSLNLERMSDILFRYPEYIVTAEIRERYQQLQNLAQKYAFLRSEGILSLDELSLDQALQDINKEELQLERVRLQAFVSATDKGCKKEFIRSKSLGLLKYIVTNFL
ncbi:uncharacterized protein TNCV_3192171 [Trichonephila clavipes]|nr:uncharacterized protein TNCV_3192171 [Trichonephila clavipes]